MAADAQVARSILVYQSTIDKIRYDLVVDECQLLNVPPPHMHAAELFFNFEGKKKN